MDFVSVSRHKFRISCGLAQSFAEWLDQQDNLIGEVLKYQTTNVFPLSLSDTESL
jgi:hypothetical protein